MTRPIAPSGHASAPDRILLAATQLRMAAQTNFEDATADHVLDDDDLDLAVIAWALPGLPADAAALSNALSDEFDHIVAGVTGM